jgi:hypothetical protein
MKLPILTGDTANMGQLLEGTVHSNTETDNTYVEMPYLFKYSMFSKSDKRSTQKTKTPHICSYHLQQEKQLKRKPH